MRSPLRRLLLGIAGFILLITTGLYVFAFVLVPDDAVAPHVTGNGEKKSGADTDSVVATPAPDEVPIPTKPPSDPRWAFLLLGYAGGRHDGTYLTDSIMVGIADPPKKTLTLLSIPRDSWVPMLFDGRTAVYNKINTAYAFATDGTLHPNRLPRYAGGQGAGTFVKDTVARLLDIPISNYVALDFAGFRQMIDTLGGIDVNVPASFDALYPANDDPSIDPSWTVVRFNKGMEHMNGERAIRFARARETINNVSEGSDFARSRRQRIIIESFKNALFQPGGLLRMPQVLGIASRYVDTDYSIPDVGQLGSFLADWREVRIHQTALTFDNYLREGTGYSGTYVLVPSFSDGTWTQIRAFARQLWHDPQVGMAMAATKITVVNSTGKAGAAGQLSEVLEKLGYRVSAPVAGEPRSSSRLIGAGDAAALLAAQLSKDLGVAIPLSADTSPPEVNTLILELGTNDLALASLTVPNDPMAPSSLVGIIRDAPAYVPPPKPEEEPTAVPPRSQAPSRSPTGAPSRPAITPSALPYATPVSGSTAFAPTRSSSAGGALTATSTPAASSTTATAIHPTATTTSGMPTSTATRTTTSAVRSPTPSVTKVATSTPTSISATPSPTAPATSTPTRTPAAPLPTAPATPIPTSISAAPSPTAPATSTPTSISATPSPTAPATSTRTATARPVSPSPTRSPAATTSAATP